MIYRSAKILAREPLLAVLREDRRQGKRLVFTNGCFDILHIGHVRLFAQARTAGDVLIVAINSDDSIRRLEKGDERPIHPQDDRAALLAAFAAIDYLTIFDEDTPIPLLDLIRPDVLVKGGDWGPHQVVGRELVESYGGRVWQVPLVSGRSTTNYVRQIRG
ncbi:MAG: D-glycero-beta-D-manno-heptose 1-phosphate adenylyltransferase [Myxococcales bacterium]|nr:D-glycero-beta-D-manno-heptose 1-phosphate adenylyltransferase [Myxococcales bacterium]